MGSDGDVRSDDACVLEHVTTAMYQRSRRCTILLRVFFGTGSGFARRHACVSISARMDIYIQVAHVACFFYDDNA